MRPVSLVDVDVHDEHAPDAAGGAQLAERRHDVVEDAEAASVARERVMRPAAEVRRDAVLERRPRGHDRRARRPTRALDQLG